MPQPLGVVVPKTEVVPLFVDTPLPLLAALALLVTEPAACWLAADLGEAEPV